MNILTNFKPLRTMKQKRLKDYLKIGSLLFGIFLVILACQEESFDKHQETIQKKKLKRITLNELNYRIGNSNDYSKLSAMFDVNKPKTTNYQNRLETSDNAYLLTDEIAVVEKENATFYTFKIESDATGNEFYNLVVAMDESNAIRSTRILEYIPSEYWLQDTSQHFNGEVKIHENDIFSVSDINNMFSARSSNQCVTGVTGEWECGAGNNHPPGHPSCTPENNAVTEFIITVHWGPCPETIDAGDSGGGGGGFPVDGGNTGGGGGGTSDGSSGNNNDDNGNPSDNRENCILDSNGNCLTDDTTPLPPRTINPCAYIDGFLTNDNIKDLIEDLNTDANLSLNYEKGYQFTKTNDGSLIPTAIDGDANDHSIQVLLNDQGTVTGFVHTHYDGLVPNFSIEDIRTFNAMYQWRKFNQKSLGDLTIMVISRGGVYALVIDDEDKFAAEGYKLHESEFKKIKKQYEKVFKKQTNPEKVERLMIDKDITLSNYGLSLMKAKDDLSGWQKVEPHPTNSNKTSYEDCN